MEVDTARRLRILSLHLTSPIACQNLSAQPCSSSAGNPPVFIGSMIMDVQGTPEPGHSLITGNSVPGRVRFIPGGVSRNIAHDFSLLISSGVAKPLLISAVGDDAAGQALVVAWRDMSLDTCGIITVPGGCTPTVSIIFNNSGDVAAAVADVALLEATMTASALRPFQNAIFNAPCVVIDADVSQQGIEAACRLAAESGGLVFFEPVSAPKAARCATSLSLIDFASPNLEELKSMAAAVARLRITRMSPHLEFASNSVSFVSCGTERLLQLIRPLLQLILDEGLRYVLLTLGSSGAALCTLSPDRQHVVVHHAPALPAVVVNCSGAGDCLVAGFLHGLLDGKAPKDALAYGLAAAKHAVECAANVPSTLSAVSLRRAAEAAPDPTEMKVPCGCCCDTCLIEASTNRP